MSVEARRYPLPTLPRFAGEGSFLPLPRQRGRAGVGVFGEYLPIIGEALG
jgi:hypothetical protein